MIYLFLRAVKQEPEDLGFYRTWEFSILDVDQIKREIDEIKIEFVAPAEREFQPKVVLSKLSNKQIEEIINKIRRYNLRKKSVTLRWNPVMNDSNVILEI